MKVKNNTVDISASFLEMADAIEGVPTVSFDWVASQAVTMMKGLAPVDTGALERGIHKTKTATRSAEIRSDAPYSTPVDQGHRTRQGTGRAPGYKPKPGGKVFVAANPFFSSVVGRIAGGDLIRRAKVDLNGVITAKISKYKGRAPR